LGPFRPDHAGSCGEKTKIYLQKSTRYNRKKITKDARENRKVVLATKVTDARLRVSQGEGHSCPTQRLSTPYPKKNHGGGKQDISGGGPDGGGTAGKKRSW